MKIGIIGASRVLVQTRSPRPAPGLPGPADIPTAMRCRSSNCSPPREIARIIRVPLTIDIEGGYSDDPGAVAQVAGGIIDAGAVGINIEDGAGPTELLCTKIDAARQRAAHAGGEFRLPM